jgi:hypothetical protein
MSAKIERCEAFQDFEMRKKVAMAETMTKIKAKSPNPVIC